MAGGLDDGNVDERSLRGIRSATPKWLPKSVEKGELGSILWKYISKKVVNDQGQYSTSLKEYISG